KHLRPYACVCALIVVDHALFNFEQKANPLHHAFHLAGRMDAAKADSLTDRGARFSSEDATRDLCCASPRSSSLPEGVSHYPKGRGSKRLPAIHRGRAERSSLA